MHRPKSSLFICQPTDCTEGAVHGKPMARVHTIQPKGFNHPFDVYCKSGGITLIQHRDPSSPGTPENNFQRNWAEYRDGFGNLTGDFWLGLDKIHRLTSQGAYSGSITIKTNPVDFPDQNHDFFFFVDLFRVGGSKFDYTLTLGPTLNYNPSQNAGDAMGVDVGPELTAHGMKFSTYNRDNDKSNATNCAQEFQAGWWFNNCTLTNINGPKINFGPYRNESVSSIMWITDVIGNATILGVEIGLNHKGCTLANC